jgi:hypothetical protein
VLSLPELAVATAAIAISAGLIAASLRLPSVTGYLLACYVISYTEVVVVTAVLSVAHLVAHWAMMLATFGLLSAGLGSWIVAGRPSAPLRFSSVHHLVDVLRDRSLAVLAIGVACAFVYVAALALFTPPNSADALWYHLARAAFWKQHHAVGYIANANDERLNGFPPVGEMAVLYTMVVSGIDRYVTLPALLGYIAMTVGVFGIARRLGVEKLEALFAALLFTTLPVVVLQASGALNDLVVGSFLVICVYFCLGGRTVDAVLAGLALALAFGTKAYAPLALPLIVTIAVLAASRSHALKLAAFGVAAVILGSTWNLINLVKTGSYLGHVQNETDYSVHGVLSILALPVRYLIDFVEVPGAKGWRAAAYVVAVLVIGASWLRSRPSPSRRSLIVAAVVAGTPFLVIAFGPLIDRAYRAFFFDLSRPDLGILGHDRSIFTASPVISYYGPLGLVLLFSPLAFFAARRERSALLVVFAAAPFLFLLALALTIGYGGLNGRFFVFSMAFAVVPFSLALHDQLIRWAVVAVALPTLLFALYANLEKPPSAWGEPRWRVQTQAGVGQADVFRFTETSIPEDAHVGLAIWKKQWSYPYFGPQLRRVVSFVPSVNSVPPNVDWLVVASSKPAPPSGWQEVMGDAHHFRVYKRELTHAREARG